MTSGKADVIAVVAEGASSGIDDLKAAFRLQEESARHPDNSIHQAWHDLKENLHVIRVAGTLLKAKAVDADARNVTEFLISASIDLQQLLTDLPDLARLEARREVCRIGPFDAAELFREVIGNVGAAVQCKGASLVTASQTLLVHGDRAKVQRIAENLIRYCLKHAHAARIDLTWEARPPTHWTFTVRSLAKGADQALSVLPERISLSVARGFCAVLNGLLHTAVEPTGVVFRVELPIDYPSA